MFYVFYYYHLFGEIKMYILSCFSCSIFSHPPMYLFILVIYVVNVNHMSSGVHGT